MSVEWFSPIAREPLGGGRCRQQGWWNTVARQRTLLTKSWKVARKSYFLQLWAPITSSFEFTVWWIVFVALRVRGFDVAHFSTILSTHPLVSNMCSTWFGRASRAWCRLVHQTRARRQNGKVLGVKCDTWCMVQLQTFVGKSSFGKN